MKKWLIYFISILALYGISIQFGFSQDDFFHLLISRADSLGDVMRFFLPQPDRWIFYRPISTQLYYYTFSLFGLHLAPILMHIFMLILHATNAYLVSDLVARIKGIKSYHATLIGFLYGIWGVHFMSLFYIGATQELLAMFFTLLAARFLASKRLFPHLIMLVLALLSKELSVRIPVFIFFYLSLTGVSLKSSFKRITPSVIIVIGYLLLRLALGVTTPAEYAFVLSPLTTFATLMWYSLMSLGLPEYILSFGLSGGAVDFASFISSTGLVGWLNLVSFLGLFILLINSLLRVGQKSILFLGLWLSSILPVILLPTHRYAHYLDLAVISVLTLLMLAGRKLRYLTLTLAIIVSVTSVRVDYLTHWTVMRSRIATSITTRVKEDQACSYETWYLTGSDQVKREVEYAVLWDNYLPIVCGHEIDLVYNQPTNVDYYLLELSESDLEK